MARLAIRALLVVTLFGMGWAAGRAQGSVPDFEIRIDAPEGKTHVECVTGCRLAWVERMVPGTVPKPQPTTFSYECSNSRTGRCESGRIGGWIQ
jgi:hypothetical protein